MKSALETNKEYSDSYVQKIDEGSIPKIVKEILERDDSVKDIIDLGCGYGGFINSIKTFDYSKKVTGIDISPKRIEFLKSKFPKDEFYVADVCDTKIKKKFDLVYSSQVIEHVEDDKKMTTEISRLAKEKGYVYVSSVIKKPFSIYKYRNRFGKFCLDPTHEREYKNLKEFLDLFKENFKLINYNIFPVKRKFFGFEIKIPGYYIVEGLWKIRNS